MEKDFRQEDVTKLNTVLNYFRSISEYGITTSNEKQLIEILNNVIDFDCYLTHEQEFPELHRLTINKKILGSNKRIDNIEFLKYPPEHLVTSYGRCNMPNQSVLYASYGMLNIYSEMKPLKGDLVTISTWRSKDNSTLKFHPIFLNQPPDGTVNLIMYNYNMEYLKLIEQYPPNMKKRITLLNSFVADMFTKRFSHNSNDLNYLFSAYFSNRMLNKNNNVDVEAIFYPSVQQKLAFENIAIKPNVFDKKYELLEVKQSFVVMDHTDNKGGCFSESVSKCNNFDIENSKILWDGTYETYTEKLQYYKDHFGYEE
jgi:hypothetical protein